MYFFRFGVGPNTPLPCRPEASGTLDCCRITAHPETILAPGTSPVSCGGPEVLGFCGLWEVDHLRNLWPTIARSQTLAGHEADINRPHCEVALIDRPLGPVGSFIDFTAKQVKESLCARITGRAT